MVKSRMNKKGFLMSDIVIYFIILILLISTFTYVLLFKPVDYRTIDFDQKRVILFEEVSSALFLKHEGKTLYEFIKFSDLSSESMAVFDDYFAKSKLCGLIVKEKGQFVAKFEDTEVLGSNDCNDLLTNMLLSPQVITVGTTEKHNFVYRIIADSRVYIVLENTADTNSMLGTYLVKKGES